jgi:hypothetical protein
MLFRTVSIFALACSCTLAAGCRDNGTLQPADLAGTGGGGGGGGGGTGGDMAMGGTKTYTMATIKAMRQGAPGDYELTDVIAIGLTPSSASPHLYIEDADGMPFSAINTNCSSSSTTHPCTVGSTVKTTMVGDKVTIKGTYIKASAASGGAENFYIDSITNNGAGTLPPAVALTQTEVARGVTTAGNYFMRVTVTPTDDLIMYDWTPTELKYSGTWPGCTTAPFVFGFGMIPATGATAPTAQCTVKTMPGPTVATPDAKEVLIGTDFYKQFTMSSDCQCAGGHAGTTVPTTATKWMSGMPMTGILIHDVPFGATAGYQYFAPTPATAGAGVLAPTGTPPP